jgi:hypothetical protein
MRFDTAEECRKVRAFIVPANEENLDRLETELPKTKRATPTDH